MKIRLIYAALVIVTIAVCTCVPKVSVQSHVITIDPVDTLHSQLQPLYEDSLHISHVYEKRGYYWYAKMRDEHNTKYMDSMAYNVVMAGQWLPFKHAGEIR